MNTNTMKEAAIAFKDGSSVVFTEHGGNLDWQIFGDRDCVADKATAGEDKSTQAIWDSCLAIGGIIE